jgi:predicted esterase
MVRDDAHILATLDEVLHRYPIDCKRIVLLGFSAGCEMGWRLLAARPQTFCFFAGVANGFKQGGPPVREAALRRAAHHVPHFYAAGQADAFAGPLFPGTARRLRVYGFELKTANPAGVGHDLPPVITTPLLAFLDQVRARQKGTQENGRSATRASSKTLLSGKPVVSWVLGAGLALGSLIYLPIILRRLSRLRHR